MSFIPSRMSRVHRTQQDLLFLHLSVAVCLTKTITFMVITVFICRKSIFPNVHQAHPYLHWNFSFLRLPKQTSSYLSITRSAFILVFFFSHWKNRILIDGLSHSIWKRNTRFLTIGWLIIFNNISKKKKKYAWSDECVG